MSISFTQFPPEIKGLILQFCDLPTCVAMRFCNRSYHKFFNTPCTSFLDDEHMEILRTKIREVDPVNSNEETKNYTIFFALNLVGKCLSYYKPQSVNITLDQCTITNLPNSLDDIIEEEQKSICNFMLKIRPEIAKKPQEEIIKDFEEYCSDPIHSIHLPGYQDGFNSLCDTLFSNSSVVRSISLANNGIKLLPLSIYKISNLVVLDLSYNELVSVPDSLCMLTSLKKLNLNNNDLRSLPATFNQSHTLESLDLSGNNNLQPKSLQRCFNTKEEILSIFDQLEKRKKASCTLL